MPNCLGIYAENNIIKYAKLNTDKNGGSLRLASYGVRFSENTRATIEAIVKETNSFEDNIATNITNERYEMIPVFSKLNKKDTKGIVDSEFANRCETKGLVPSVLEMKYKIAKNTGDADKYNAICVYANRPELTNVFQNFTDYKLTSVSPLGVSINNVLPNKGLNDDIAIINIEDSTTITIIEKGEIADITSFPVGMKDVLPKLAEKYNSYPKAYEACKGVSAYIEDVYALEDSDREVLDLLIPMLYDLRSRVEKYILPHLSHINKIYLTGTGVIINNLDLYFNEVLQEKTCQILVPYFLQKDSNNLKDIVEVNTAIAIAFNGIGYNDKDMDFNSGSSATLIQGTAFVKKFNELKEKTVDFLAANDFLGRKAKKERASKKKKIDIEFNDEVVEQTAIDDEQPMVTFEDETNNIVDTEEKEPFLTKGEASIARTAGAVALALCLYSGASYLTNDVITNKINETNKNEAQVNGWIKQAEEDRTSISKEAQSYVSMRTNLEELLNKVTNRKVTFAIPNYMSKLMFTIPENVKVTSISVLDGKVTMEAESGQYSQLGYFVSRLKLDRVLTNVDMSVESMSGNIKIRISGEMP